MMIKTRRATVLLCSAAVALLATSAFARPVHHHHRQRAAQTSPVAAQPAVADRDMRYSFNPMQAVVPAAGETVRARRHSRLTLADARTRAQSHTNSAYGGSTSNSLV